MNGIIYKTTNLLSGKIYVGIYTQKDKNYLGSGKYLKSAVEKHGRENFKRVTIDEFDDIEIGLAKERYWIHELNSKWPIGYNLNGGGRGGFNPCQESRDKMSAASKGRPGYWTGKKRDKKTIESVILAHKGKHLSEEHKKKISVGLMGISHSEETKKKMSIAKMGNKHALGAVRSKETIEKLRIAAKNRSKHGK